jgi:putative peptidoglycan lipid II flippase
VPSERAGASVTRNAGIVAAGTLVSRVLGAVRDAVLAATFPVAVLDAWIVAFTIPNALRALLAEGAVTSAFIPLYADAKAKEGAARALEVHRTLNGALLLVLALVSVAGVLSAPWLVTMYASGYAASPERHDTAVLLVRIVFPYIFFMGSAAVGMAALNANGRFAVPAVTPALLNVAMIAAPWLLVPPMLALGLPAVASLAVAALIGGALQVVAQWPALAAIGHLRSPRLALADPVVKRAGALLLPVTIGLGVYQLNVLLSRQFASYLPEGAQTYLYNGQRLIEIPQGMFALALASASLPRLSALRAAGDDEGVRATFASGLRQALFVALPATALLMALAQPIVAVIFGRGEYGRSDVLETSWSLLFQGAGVAFVALVRVFIPAFYAHGDTKSPVWASAGNLVAFAALALALRGPMGHAGIALAISAAGAVQLALLAALLRRRMGRVLPASLGVAGLSLAAARLALASVAAGAAGWGVAQLGAWERGGNDAVNVVVLAAACLAAGLAYLAICRLLGAPELDDVLAALRRRRARAGPPT